jgi:protein O-mannosyl-transferase
MSSASPSPDGRVSPPPAALVLAAVALHLLVYAAAIPGSFTFDDRSIVVMDPRVSGPAPLGETFSRPYFMPGQYRPLTLFSLGLDVRLFGLSPTALRVENLVWAGLGVGLFAWLAALLGAPRFAVWSLVLLLSVHPVRSEAIVTVVGRSEMLVFALMTAALLAGRASSIGRGNGRRTLLAAGSGFLVLLALLSKENAFVAPGLLAGFLLLDSSKGERSFRGWSQIKPLVIAWALAFALVFAARRLGMGAFLTGDKFVIDPFDNVLARLPSRERPPAAISLLNLARNRLVWPRILAADYGPVSFPREQLLGPAAVSAGAATLLGGALLVFAFWKRRPLVSFGLAWAALTYLPFANLFFLTGSAFAERLLHLPAAGVMLALTGLFPRRPVERWIRTVVGGVVLGTFLLAVVRIERRIPEWEDDRTLFAATVRDVPLNGRAWFNLAVIALSDKDVAAVRQAVTKALQADPRLAGRVAGLIAHAEVIGRQDEAVAIREGAAAAGRPAP